MLKIVKYFVKTKLHSWPIGKCRVLVLCKQAELIWHGVNHMENITKFLALPHYSVTIITEIEIANSCMQHCTATEKQESVKKY